MIRKTRSERARASELMKKKGKKRERKGRKGLGGARRVVKGAEKRGAIKRAARHSGARRSLALSLSRPEFRAREEHFGAENSRKRLLWQ